jgi:hypothetical protein
MSRREAATGLMRAAKFTLRRTQRFTRASRGGPAVGSTGINVGAGYPTTAEAFNNIFAASASLNPGLSGTRFSFVSDESFAAGSSGIQSQLYLESITFVPEPTTAALVGLGLIGLAIANRRQRS